MVALVYYLDKVVEVPDATYSLEDIRDALGQAEGVLRERNGERRVVVTLPFEPLPSTEDGIEYELIVLRTSEVSSASAAGPVLQGAAAGGDGQKTALSVDDETIDVHDAAYQMAYMPQHITSSGTALYVGSHYNPFLTATTTESARCSSSQVGGSRPYLSTMEAYR